MSRAEALAVALDAAEEDSDYPVDLRLRIARLLPRLRLTTRWRGSTLHAAHSGEELARVFHPHDRLPAPGAVARWGAAIRVGGLLRSVEQAEREGYPRVTSRPEAQVWCEAELRADGWVIPPEEGA